MKPRRGAVLALALVLSLFLVGTAIAATTTRTARALTQVKVVHGGDATTTNSTSFVDLPGASTTITVASNTRALVLARFSAESACSGGTGYCPVRILINGTEADPAVGNDFAFDSTDGGNDTAASWESHAVERSRAYFTPGTYTVRVQYKTTQSATILRLDDWTLVVEAIAA